MIMFLVNWLIYILQICKFSIFYCRCTDKFTDVVSSGGHAPSYLYRIVAEHYRVEDIDI